MKMLSTQLIRDPTLVIVVVVWFVFLTSGGVLVDAGQLRDASETVPLRPPSQDGPVVAAVDGVDQTAGNEGTEYCLSEAFNATCRRAAGSSSSDVIIMTSAEYGRMRSGRCVQMKYGQPGCRADVLARLDAHCSGRPSCSFPVTRLLQAGVSPCDDELKPYLFASYRCVTVARQTCAANENHRTLSAQSGYIGLPGPSPVAAGSARCPWKLAVDRRQGIRVVLYTFAGDGGGQAAAAGEACHVAAVLDGHEVVELCQEGSRHSARQLLLHSTDSNQLTISFRVTHDRPARLPVSYLLHYEAVGCPTFRLLDWMGSAWVQQDSGTVTVRCNQTDETWYLQCDGRRWKGSVGNCSASTLLAVANDAEPRTFKSASLSFGLVVAVIIGVVLGVVIGAVPLGLAYICLKRKWRQQTPDGYMPGDQVYDPAAFSKVMDIDSSTRQHLYPGLLASHHAHVQQQQQPTRQPVGYYSTGCPHSAACPVHNLADGGGATWDDCCPAAGTTTGRLGHEHVYESAVVGTGFATRCRAPVIAVDDAYLPPGMTATTEALTMTAGVHHQLFDAGRV